MRGGKQLLCFEPFWHVNHQPIQNFHIDRSREENRDRAKKTEFTLNSLHSSTREFAYFNDTTCKMRKSHYEHKILLTSILWGEMVKLWVAPVGDDQRQVNLLRNGCYRNGILKNYDYLKDGAHCFYTKCTATEGKALIHSHSHTHLCDCLHWVDDGSICFKTNTHTHTYQRGLAQFRGHTNWI